MLPGFPKRVTTTKIKSGHYRIVRDDGYAIEVRRSALGYWYKVDNIFARERTLAAFVHDVKHGFTVHDQLAGVWLDA